MIEISDETPEEKEEWEKLEKKIVNDKPKIHDWPEDWDHDNGMYSNKCITCTTFFIGNKYRRVCKVCHEESRVVVCAATQLVLSDNGEMSPLIICSPRHWDRITHNVVNKLDSKLNIEDEVQGFVDQYGVFMTREEAKKIAERKNQIIRQVGGDTFRLYSENLY